MKRFTKKILVLLGCFFVCVFAFISFLMWRFDRVFNERNILFTYSDKDGLKSYLTLAKKDINDGKLWMYHIKNINNESPFYVTKTTSTNDANIPKAVSVGMIIHHVMALSISDQLQQAAQVDLSRETVLQSLWQTALIHSMSNPLYLLHTMWWLANIQFTAQLNIQERIFESADDWAQYMPQRDMQLTNQPCSIAVVNTTPSSGIATDLANVLERSGLFVARTTQTATNISQSMLLAESIDGCEEVIEHVSTLIDASQKVTFNEDVTARYRARVVLLVGQDLASVVEELRNEH